MAEIESIESIKYIYRSSLCSVGLAYFIEKYWKERNSIFNELYKILYNEELSNDETKELGNQQDTTR